MATQYELVCPACTHVIINVDTCPQCGWQRPRATDGLGGPLDKPCALSRVVYGRPLQHGPVVWYAAPPEERAQAGALIAIRGGGAIIERHDLRELLAGGGDARAAGLPVAEGLAGDEKRLLLGVRDYALGSGRPTKALLLRDALTLGALAALPVPSLELSTPARRGTLVAVSGTGKDAVYLFELAPRAAASTLRWHVDLPHVAFRETPAVTADCVAVTHGSLWSDQRFVRGLATADGRQLWEHSARKLSQVYADPQHNRFYLAVGSELRAIDGTTGEPLWRNTALRRTSRGVLTAPPAFLNDLLLVPGGSDDEQQPYMLYALDAANGDIRWRWPVPTNRNGHIVVAPLVQDGRIVVGDLRGWLYELSRDGQLVWQREMPQRVTATPCIDGARLLVPLRDATLHVLAWQVSTRPTQAPDAYVARGEWALAAAAYALAEPPDWAQAIDALLRANQPRTALALARHAGQPAGEARALQRLGQLDEALPPARAAGLHAELAEWLREAQRFGEAGAAFEQAQQWLAAGDCYLLAARPVQAAAMFDRAGRSDRAAEALADAGSNVGELAAFLKRSINWRAVVERLIRNGHDQTAADIYEMYGELAAALPLRRKAKKWDRVRELAAALDDWQAEAEAYTALAERAKSSADAAQQWEAAGDLYMQHHDYAAAEGCYARLYDRFKLAKAIEARGDFERAAVLCADPDQPYPLMAAQCYQRAAEQASAAIPRGVKREPAIARLWALAAEWYNYAGRADEQTHARLQEIQWLLLPHLLLEQAHIDRPFQVGMATVVQMQVRNVGSTPAGNITLRLDGGALPRINDHSPLPVLPPNAYIPLHVTIVPTVPSQGDQPLAFRFTLSYQRAIGGAQEQLDNVYEINAPVAPDYAGNLGSGGTLNIFNHGSAAYQAGGDQVNSVRTVNARAVDDAGAGNTIFAAAGDPVNVPHGAPPAADERHNDSAEADA